MDELVTRAKLPIRYTYRAVGSSTGQKEFINADDNDNNNNAAAAPAADFGSGDIPLSTAQHDLLTAANVEVMHLPVFVGAVAVFHSVPLHAGHHFPLNMTGCLLARIYTGEITDWSHDDIRALNPNMNIGAALPIQVARRVKGSSSTSAFTEVCACVRVLIWR